MFEFNTSFWQIGYDKPVFIIAEAGVNHNGDLSIAQAMIRVAAASGANAVKFQTFDVNALVSRAHDEEQWNMLSKLHLSYTDHKILIDECHKNDIIFLSSPFDVRSLEFLHSLNVPAIKIPSGEITNTPLLYAAASTGLPLIVSTGMSNLVEVKAAVSCIAQVGNPNLCLLHCLSAYPAPTEELNLRALRTLSDTFSIPIGFSDHTTGIFASIMAVAIGACIIEKHFTLDKNMDGPDQKASINPEELTYMVNHIRKAEEALGSGEKVCQPSEEQTALKARKSLVASRTIKKNTTIDFTMVTLLRPGTGMYPYSINSLLGKKTKKKIKKHEMFSPNNVDLRMN